MIQSFASPAVGRLELDKRAIMDRSDELNVLSARAHVRRGSHGNAPMPYGKQKPIDPQLVTLDGHRSPPGISVELFFQPIVRKCAFVTVIAHCFYSDEKSHLRISIAAKPTTIYNCFLFCPVIVKVSP